MQIKVLQGRTRQRRGSDGELWELRGECAPRGLVVVGHRRQSRGRGSESSMEAAPLGMLCGCPVPPVQPWVLILTAVFTSSPLTAETRLSAQWLTLSPHALP